MPANENSLKQRKYKLPGTIMRWLALGLPVVLVIPIVSRVDRYPLVLRNDTISPAIGLPWFLLLVSLGPTIVYSWVIFKYCRQQISFVMRKGAHDLSFLAFVLLPFGMWLLSFCSMLVLNGSLDSSQPVTVRTEIMGLTRFRRTPYVTVKDWKAKNDYVYFLDDGVFSAEHPLGSSINVTTKKGLLGYEWYVK
jgi:hypothetical protein